jgi:hypothetical protein
VMCLGVKLKSGGLVMANLDYQLGHVERYLGE